MIGRFYSGDYDLRGNNFQDSEVIYLEGVNLFLVLYVRDVHSQLAVTLYMLPTSENPEVVPALR